MIAINCELCGAAIEITDGAAFWRYGATCPACARLYFITTRPASRAIAVSGSGAKVTVYGDVAGRDLVRGGKKQ